MAAVRFGKDSVLIERVEASAYTVPTDYPESDGTLEWDKTALVVAEVFSGGVRTGEAGYHSRAVGSTLADKAGVIPREGVRQLPSRRHNQHLMRWTICCASIFSPADFPLPSTWAFKRLAAVNLPP